MDEIDPHALLASNKKYYCPGAPRKYEQLNYKYRDNSNKYEHDSRWYKFIYRQFEVQATEQNTTNTGCCILACIGPITVGEKN